MKKISNVLLSVSILLITLMLFVVEYNKDEEVYKNKPNTFKTNNALAIMLDDGNGNYNPSDSNAFPTSGYTFNSELSRCENNSTIAWNEETKKVIVSSNKSDKCYVYFDKVPFDVNFKVESGWAGTNQLISISLDIKNNTSNYIRLSFKLNSNNSNINFEFNESSGNLFIGEEIAPGRNSEGTIIYEILNSISDFNETVTIYPTLEIIDGYNSNNKRVISLGEFPIIYISTEPPTPPGPVSPTTPTNPDPD